MTRIPSKTRTGDAARSKRNRPGFRPDIRLANAIVGAIVFLQKAGLLATPRVIKKCIRERSRKSFSKNIEQLPVYLNRGLELGILKKWNGSYKLGDFQLKKRVVKKKKTEKGSKTVEVIKGAADNIKSNEQSEKNSMCAF